MEKIEAEVAKLSLGSAKTAGSAVHLLAEPSQTDDLELFGLCEFPLLNPVAAVAGNHSSEVIFAALRRSFRQARGQSAFEAALLEINQSFASESDPNAGSALQLSSILAVRDGLDVHIAVHGKVAAFLLRKGAWKSIADSGDASSSDSKFFSTFSTGTVAANDYLVLATGETFNFLSLHRLQNLLETRNLAGASEEAAHILEDIAGPSAAFGMLIIKLTHPGSDAHFAESDSEDHDAVKLSRLRQLQDMGKHAAHFTQSALSWVQTRLRPGTKHVAIGVANISRIGLDRAGRVGQSAKNFPSRMALYWKSASRTMRWSILVGILILFVAAYIFVRIQRAETLVARTLEQNEISLQESEKLLNESASRQISGDNKYAHDLLKKAGMLLDSLQNPTEQQLARKSHLASEALKLSNKLEKILPVLVSHVATLGNTVRLVSLPDQISTIKDEVASTFNIPSGETAEKPVAGIQQYVAGVAIDKSHVVYDGDSLKVWDPASGETGEAFFQQVPKHSDFGGIAYFADRRRLYVADNARRQITIFDINGTVISKPSGWNSSALPEGTIRDIAVDGNVYILGEFGLQKMYQGKVVAGFFDAVPLSLDAATRVLAGVNDPYIYVLDSVNEQIAVLEKSGKMIGVIKATEIKNASDILAFPDNQLYILSQGELIKLTWQPPATP